jgi:hypothetical protein
MFAFDRPVDTAACRLRVVLVIGEQGDLQDNAASFCTAVRCGRVMARKASDGEAKNDFQDAPGAYE